MKNNYRIGNQIVQCDFLYNIMVESSKQYLANTDCTPDIIINYDLLELENNNRFHNHLTIEQCECIYSLEQYALKAVQFNKLLLHASVIILNGRAIIFCGDSSVGKTTQINLWKVYYGKDLEVLSDDRPVVGNLNGSVFVWNTPWSKYQNTALCHDGVRVGAICFLQQNRANSLELLRNLEARQFLLELYPKSIHDEIKDSVNEIIQNVPCFLFQNNASLSYVRKAYETIMSAN